MEATAVSVPGSPGRSLKKERAQVLSVPLRKHAPPVPEVPRPAPLRPAGPGSREHGGPSEEVSYEHRLPPQSPGLCASRCARRKPTTGEAGRGDWAEVVQLSSPPEGKSEDYKSQRILRAEQCHGMLGIVVHLSECLQEL